MGGTASRKAGGSDQGLARTEKADARALKLLPREAVAMSERERSAADAEALEWAKRNPGQLAKAIKAWSGE